MLHINSKFKIITIKPIKCNIIHEIDYQKNKIQNTDKIYNKLEENIKTKINNELHKIETIIDQ